MKILFVYCFLFTILAINAAGNRNKKRSLTEFINNSLVKNGFEFTFTSSLTFIVDLHFIENNYAFLEYKLQQNINTELNYIPFNKKWIYFIKNVTLKIDPKQINMSECTGLNTRTFSFGKFLTEKMYEYFGFDLSDYVNIDTILQFNCFPLSYLSTSTNQPLTTKDTSITTTIITTTDKLSTSNNIPTRTDSITTTSTFKYLSSSYISSTSSVLTKTTFIITTTLSPTSKMNETTTDIITTKTTTEYLSTTTKPTTKGIETTLAITTINSTSKFFSTSILPNITTSITTNTISNDASSTKILNTTIKSTTSFPFTTSFKMTETTAVSTLVNLNLRMTFLKNFTDEFNDLQSSNSMQFIENFKNFVIIFYNLFQI